MEQVKAAHKAAMATLRIEMEGEREQALLEAAKQQEEAMKQLEEQLKVLLLPLFNLLLPLHSFDPFFFFLLSTLLPAGKACW